MPPVLRALLALTLACCASPPPPTVTRLPEEPAPRTAATVALSAATSVPAPVPSASVARPASSPPASPGAFQPLTDDEERRLVAPHLAGAQLAHPAFRGPFGPAPDAIIAVTTTASAPPASFGGMVVLADGRVLPLPPLHDHWSGWEVHAVLFEDVDGDGARELIVIAEYITGIGPQGAAPFFFNSVVRWDGGAFVRLPEVEKRLARATDAAGVRRALGARPPRGR